MTEISLLEFLALKLNCVCLSDLRFLPDWRRKQLANEIENIPPQNVSVSEWNDALCYLTESEAEKTKEEARIRLISLLRG